VGRVWTDGEIEWLASLSCPLTNHVARPPQIPLPPHCIVKSERRLKAPLGQGFWAKGSRSRYYPSDWSTKPCTESIPNRSALSRPPLIRPLSSRPLPNVSRQCPRYLAGPASFKQCQLLFMSASQSPTKLLTLFPVEVSLVPLRLRLEGSLTVFIQRTYPYQAGYKRWRIIYLFIYLFIRVYSYTLVIAVILNDRLISTPASRFQSLPVHLPDMSRLGQQPPASIELKGAFSLFGYTRCYREVGLPLPGLLGSWCRCRTWQGGGLYGV
jgi:hypothetical protein